MEHLERIFCTDILVEIAQFAMSIDAAVETSNTKALQLLLRSPAAARKARIHYKSARLINKAVERGNLDMIKALLANNINICTYSALKWVIKNGHHDVAKKLSTRHQIKNPFNALNDAIRNNCLDDVKWIVQNIDFNQMKNSEADSIDWAAENGHLDIVKWLTKQEAKLEKAMNLPRRPQPPPADSKGSDYERTWDVPPSLLGCTTDAMDGAARRGHLDVVKWLHENRTEGCSDDALECAAENGHLEVVKWLAENRREGDIGGAQCFAADEGRTEVVQWLSDLFQKWGPDAPPRRYVESREHRSECSSYSRRWAYDGEFGRFRT